MIVHIGHVERFRIITKYIRIFIFISLDIFVDACVRFLLITLRHGRTVNCDCTTPVSVWMRQLARYSAVGHRAVRVKKETEVI